MEVNEVRIKLSLRTKLVSFKILWTWLVLAQILGSVSGIYPRLNHIYSIYMA